MNALAPGSDHFLLDDGRVTNAYGRVADVLQQPRGVGLASVGVLVPSAVGVMDTSQAVVVPLVAHDEVYLPDSVV